MNHEALLSVLSNSNMGDAIMKVLQDPQARDQAFASLRLPRNIEDAIRKELGTAKNTAGAPVVHTVEDYAQRFCDLGIPPDQAMMAAMMEKGETQVAIAVYLGKKYPRLQISPQVVHFMLTSEIVPRIKTLLGAMAEQQKPVETPKT